MEAVETQNQLLDSVGHLDCNQVSTAEDLRFWREQVLRYFELKRLSVGLNGAEQDLVKGLQETVDSLSGR